MQHLLPPAVDIGTTHVRVVRLARDAAGVHLVTWQEVELPVGALVEGQIKKVDELKAVLRPVLRSFGLRKRFAGLPFGFSSCVTTLPYHLTAAKLCKLEGVDIHDHKRTRQAAQWKAAEFANEAPLDLYDECSVTSMLAGTAPDEFFVFKTLRKPLVAIGRLFRDLGAIAVVENPAIALTRAYPNAQAIVDVGTSRSTLIVPIPNAMPDVKSFGYGADTVAERTRSGFVISRAEARERVRREGSVDRSAAWSTQQFGKDLSQHIRKLRTDHNLQITEAVLVGNGSRIRGLADALASEAAIKIVSATMQGIASGGVPGKVFEDLAPSIALATGLALGEPARVGLRFPLPGAHKQAAAPAPAAAPEPAPAGTPA